MIVPKHRGVYDPLSPSSPGKNAVVAFFPVAKLAAKLLAAPKIATCVAILRSHPAINAAGEYFPGC